MIPALFPGAGRISSCVLYLLQSLLLVFWEGALEMLYIHLYIYTHTLVLKEKHCMIVIEMMLR